MGQARAVLRPIADWAVLLNGLEQSQTGPTELKMSLNQVWESCVGYSEAG